MLIALQHDRETSVILQRMLLSLAKINFLSTRSATAEDD